MGERTNCEKRIEHEKFNLKIGTTNRNNPLVVYVEGKTFISPTVEKNSYNCDISDIKKNLNRFISNELKSSTMFEENHILDFQVAQSGINVNKKSFLNFQFLFKQKKDKIMKIKDIKEKSKPFIYDILSHLEESIVNHDFSISKTKKQ